MLSRTLTIAAAVCIAVTFCFGQLQAAETRPNILFVLVDDLGWADVGCNGSTFYETPNIDRLAAEGMRFTDAYSASAICAPARASIITGKYPSRMGITRASPQESLPFSDITIAEALKAGGYRTAHLGKWHLEAHNNQGPRSYTTTRPSGAATWSIR